MPYIKYMILQLQTGKDNKILRAKSQKVTDFSNSEIRHLIKNMTETLDSMKAVAIGLAAPQIGVNARIFVISPEVYKEHVVFVNPKISKSFKKTLLEEGCLSLPRIYGSVRRSVSVKVEAFDENGKKFKLRATGLLAHVIQHETDHLDGILFIDKAKKAWELKETK